MSVKSLIGLFLFSVAFASPVGTASLVNGFSELSPFSSSEQPKQLRKRKVAIPKEIKISVITEDEARDLFKDFASNPSIPFKFAPDGCYARATAMARIAEIKGIQAAKVYAEGLLQAKLEGNEQFPTVNWGWHVAPVISVKGKNGKNEVMVFDPSLFSRPATVEEWKQKMMDTSNGFKPEVREVYFGTRYEYYSKSYETYKGQWDPENLVAAQIKMKEYLMYQSHPELSPFGEVMQQGADQTEATWKTQKSSPGQSTKGAQ